MSIVLITGCSSGFGNLIARTLATHGHHVYASMRQMDGRNATPAQEQRDWARMHNLTLETLELDVGSDESAQHAVDHVLAGGKGIDVVVNNAAISSVGPLEAYTSEQMMNLLSVNVLGPMRVNNAVLPTLRRQRSGLIIWITSTLGRVLPSIGGLYPATKWAAEGFAESLHYQLRPFGIDVVILEPGSFPTPATSKGVDPAKKAIVAEYAAAAPAGGTTPVAPGPDYKPPDPQEVADAVNQLVDMPSGHRPLRLVVGPVFTEGVADYNAAYLQVRANLERALRRADQAITWTPDARARTS
jgi:NAD(P)-dependent dehydrogenase (short-subunit alcohol dehydrogenase family)